MLATHAPPSLIKPLFFSFSSSLSTLSATLSPIPSTKLLNFRPRRTSFRALTTMAGTKSDCTGYSSPEHVAGNWYSVPDLRLRDHRFMVPLDYKDREASSKISIFAREVVAAGKEEQLMPYLLYLQGGPGFECPRPTEGNGWILKACEEFRVILMDQRGTGLSTPLTPSSMQQMKSAQSLADYLKHFRADSIVNDAEFIRVHLVPDARPWTVLGQSYGGFCGVTYLSFAPQGLKQVLLTGGIPPMGDGCTADAVYSACFGQVIRQNEKYYKRFPQDVEIVRDVITYLAESEGGGVLLPSGGILTPRGLQFLGLSGLGSSAGFERLHYLFERVWDPMLVPGAPKRISSYFLNAYESWLAFDTNPLYAILHESIYCQGASSRWSAHRVRADHDSKFDAIRAAREGRPVLLTGEMIFPWMFDEVNALRPFKDAAHLLAEKEDWPPLYDIAALKNNKVPVAAAVYYEDMYVNIKLVMETASQIAGIRLWITNEYMHSGLRDGGGQVFDHLMGMLNGKKPLF
ncbi:PREDICTED: proline iminopeptidase [Theobroma cacao]|uniref:Proline iminopeptidase n=1 Tax=Theobroma cacao TaxID=3641 RepID=A0AB32VQN2_THECC|nr:PREDICTED: proline iminopeptidase [Theobroma cacao]